jgi:hypothetical protein
VQVFGVRSIPNTEHRPRVVDLLEQSARVGQTLKRNSTKLARGETLVA